MSKLILNLLVIDQSEFERGRELKEELVGTSCVMDGDEFQITRPNGESLAVADVSLNEQRNKMRVIRGTVLGLDLGMGFEPNENETPPITVVGRTPPPPKAESAGIVGRWVPSVVEYLPVDDGEDDGGFSDEGFGETMDAGDLMDKTDHVEFAEDGTVKGKYWGAEQSGTWRLDGGTLHVTFWGSETKWPMTRNGELVRSDDDEEHGRAYDVFYKRA